MDVKQNDNRNRRSGANPRARGRGRGRGAAARNDSAPAAASAAAGAGAGARGGRGRGRGRGGGRGRGRVANGGGRGGGGGGNNGGGGAAGATEAAARAKIDGLVDALVRHKRAATAAARELALQQVTAGLITESEYALRLREIALSAWNAFDTKRFNYGGASAQYSADRQRVTVVLPKLSGVFRCAQCNAFWVSAQSAVDFRGAAVESNNPPRCVKLWHQQCKLCGRDEWPEFDVKIGAESEDRWEWLSERVTRVLNIMSGVPVADVRHDDGRADPDKPHLSALCERCKAGKFCTESGAGAGAK